MSHRASRLLSRRGFMFAAGATAVGAALPAPALALPRPRVQLGEPRQARMLHQASGEVFAETYFDGTNYLPEALEYFSRFGRDLHVDEERHMDARLLDLAWIIQSTMASIAPLVVTSAYRTPETNSRTKGAAKNSFHVQGMALDIKHDAGADALYEVAERHGFGGVGRYETFVHIDTGERRRW